MVWHYWFCYSFPFACTFFHFNEIAYLVEPTFIVKLDIVCYQVFVGARLHVTGGALRGGRGVEGEAAIAGKLLASTNHVWLLLKLVCFVFTLSC